MRTCYLGGNTRMTVRNAEDARRGRTQRDSSTLSLYWRCCGREVAWVRWVVAARGVYADTIRGSSGR